MTAAEKPLTERLANAAAKRDGTEYVVLASIPFLDSDDGHETYAWMQIGGAVRANNAEQAIRQRAFVPNLGETVREGRYVAVPVRSFQVVAVRAETQTRLLIEEA